jgi:predicted metallopeptidase
MGIRYERAPDIEDRVFDIVRKLGMGHVNLARVSCIRSRGSSSRYVLARCHTLTRIFQHALGIKAHYIIEVISERFDSLTREEQTRTLIHELMHIPRTFGGGFKHHDLVNRRSVEMMYRRYRKGQ